MRAVLLVVIAVGCGGTSSTPAPADPGSAFRSTGLPAIPVPPARAASEAGAHTDRHPNGRPRSHGLYVVSGDRAVAHGVWTFWLADGSRQSQGRYQRGEPVGCFAIRAGGGHVVTGIADSGTLRPAACDPPRHPAAEVLELAAGRAGHAIADLNFQTFVAPWSSLGAKTTLYATADPELTGTLIVLWRRRLEEWRFGGAAGVRGAEFGYYGLTAAGVAGWGQAVTSWLDVDVWGELGILFMHATPHLEDKREGREYLWTPLSAAQAEVGLRAGSSLELTLGGRLELRYPRSVDRQTIFCRAPCDPMTDTWKTGGIAAGLVVGLRFLVW